ncbi:MAG: hypothetical protein J0M12_11080 [Deltaproteobacteria bacterium]|nr:hypothetical protein [Deltaproteobacteria bacterium]
MRIVVLVALASVLAWVFFGNERSPEEGGSSPMPPYSALPTASPVPARIEDAFPSGSPVFPTHAAIRNSTGFPEGGEVTLDSGVEAAETKAAATSTPLPTLVATETPTAQPTASEDPAIEALRELQTPTPDDGLLSGARNSKPGAPTSFLQPTPTVNADPTATPALPRVGGMATGYTMLYLMHPRARLTVERQIEAMLKANLNEVYLGAMVDGTFSLDYDYLESVIRRLSADNRTLTLVLYFANGSAMRSYDRTPINVGFNLIPPDAFRAMIEFDDPTRRQFQQMVSRAIPSYELNRALNPRSTNIAIMMLEDNLDQDSYRAMRDLARGVLGDRAEIIRNPCPGCYQGNDAYSAEATESHDPDAVQGLLSRDGFSLDGSGYELPGDPPNQQLSQDAVRQLKTIAISRGLRYFGLWRKQRQGLGDTLIHPNVRNYEVPSDAQVQSEVDLLRWGLDLLTPTPEPDSEEEEE